MVGHVVVVVWSFVAGLQDSSVYGPMERIEAVKLAARLRALGYEAERRELSTAADAARTLSYLAGGE